MNPAKAPMPPSTSGRNVVFASGAIRRTASSPASISTPVSRYVRGFIALDVEEAELGRGLGLDADLVGAGEAGVTEARGIAARGLQHAVERQVAERVGAEVAADLLDVVAGPDQLLARRRVDAVVTGPLDRRRRDPHVDLAGARVAEHAHDLAAGGPAHDRVVDHHHALALQHLGHRVQLHLHAEVPDALLGLDEGAADVMVADQAHLVRRARLLGVPEGRARPRVRHGDHDVGRDGMLARELVAERLAYGVDVAAPQRGVRAREVDVLEHALQLLAGRKARTERGPPVSITRISPGSTSRSTFASMRSSAQVSEATTHAASSRPSVRGRNPYGSRIAYIASGVSTSSE